MMTRYWGPGNAMRFVERGGKHILQQAWTLNVYSGWERGWVNGGEHRWEDVPLMLENDQEIDKKYWMREE